MKKTLSEIMLSARLPLIQWGGVLVMFLGLLLTAVGAHPAAGGASIVIGFPLAPELFAVEIDQVLGLVSSIVGIAFLVAGIALCYVGFKLQRLNVVCIILGSCGLIIPSMTLGMGYNLAAGIAAIAIGFPWLATLFLWFTGGERE